MLKQRNRKANRGSIAAAIVATTTFFAALALLVEWAATLGLNL